MKAYHATFKNAYFKIMTIKLQIAEIWNLEKLSILSRKTGK